MLGERRPGLAKTCEARVNRCQVVSIGAGVTLLRRCRGKPRNPWVVVAKAFYETWPSGGIPATRGTGVLVRLAGKHPVF